MMDTQPESSEDVAMEVPEARFLKSLIAVCKENRDVLSSLPEMMESLIANEEHLLNVTKIHQFEEYRKSKEKELIAKEKTLEEAEKHVKHSEEENRKLKTELQKTKKEISKREKEITKREEDISVTTKQNEEKLSGKEAEIQKMRDKYSKELEEYRRSNDAIAKENEAKDEQIKQYSQRNKSLKNEIEAQEDKIKQYSQSMSQAKDDLKAAYTKMEGYKSRLASLSDKRVKQDQRLVEDTLGSNRQSELERDFSAFFDEDRMDACEKMQSLYLNKEDDFIYLFYPRLACIIFETAYEQAKEVKEATSYLFKEFTNIMIHHAAGMGTDLCAKRKLYMQGKYGYQMCSFPITVALWGERSDYPKEVMDGMTLSLKEAAHICNLDSLVQDVSNITFVKWKEWCEEDITCMFSPAWNLIVGLDKYIKASIRITWRMVTQVPPMKLEYHCSKFQKDLHRNVSKVSAGTHSSAQPDQEEEIACYLWPGLQDGGGRRIRPGEVLCKVTKTRQ